MRHLDARGDKKLTEVPLVDEPEGVIRVVLSDCIGLVDAEALSSYTNLEVLNCSGCVSLVSIPDLSPLKHLKVINLHNCCSLTQLTGIEAAAHLQALVLTGCSSLVSVPRISGFAELRVVLARKLRSLTKPLELGNLPQLYVADLHGTWAVMAAGALEDLVILQ